MNQEEHEWNADLCSYMNSFPPTVSWTYLNQWARGRRSYRDGPETCASSKCDRKVSEHKLWQWALWATRGQQKKTQNFNTHMYVQHWNYLSGNVAKSNNSNSCNSEVWSEPIVTNYRGTSSPSRVTKYLSLHEELELLVFFWSKSPCRESTLTCRSYCMSRLISMLVCCSSMNSWWATYCLIGCCASCWE